jgi:two-component system cell cycle response regulator
MSRRILIVDDVASNRIVYQARLASAFYEPVLAADGAGCLAAALSVPEAQRPDLIVLDLDLPDMPGDGVLRALRADPRGRDIPVIVLAARGDAGARLAAFAAGADDVLQKPVADQLFMARVRNLIRTRPEGAPGDALADAGSGFGPGFGLAHGHGGPAPRLSDSGRSEVGRPDPARGSLPEGGFAAAGDGAARRRAPAAGGRRSGHRAAGPTFGLAEAAAPFEPPGTLALIAPPCEAARDLQADLAAQTRDRLVLMSRAEVLAEAAADGAPQPPADVYVLDAGADGADAALRLLSELKSNQATRHAAICLLDRTGDADAAAMAFDLGADDVAPYGLPGRELAVRLRSLMRRKRAADQRRARVQDSLRLALVDPLTGLYNRRFAGPQLAAIAARAAETGERFAVMVVDLDRFKLVNDTHGHAAGDAVLVEVARRLGAALREGDLLARIGGEEFLVALPACPMPMARRIAERLCQSIDERPVRLPSGQRLRVTVSIGVAVSDGRTLADAVVEQADLALLESKGAGRNQVTFRQSAA